MKEVGFRGPPEAPVSIHPSAGAGAWRRPVTVASAGQKRSYGVEMAGNLKPVGRPTTANAVTAIVAEEDFQNLNWEGYTSIEVFFILLIQLSDELTPHKQ